MIRIAKGLELPSDVVTQAIAILARRGAGKTYTGSVLVEEVVKAKLPVVVLDPTGAWWGLRTSADGEKPGLPVVIFGGEHGDVPLAAHAGKVIADVVIEHPGAYVIDLSGFDSKAAEQRFAGDFLERLYRGKATRREALLLVVDEADLLAPQRPGPEQTRTLGALEAIVRRGRIRGLGVVLISQRAAVLNKNVLTQVEVLVAMQTTGPQDRAAIDDWIAGNGTREERDTVLGSLASLERGEAWLWSPSWLRRLERIQIRKRETFDSSKTPEAGAAAVTPRAFAQVDLEKLGERIRESAEQAKANDPTELRKQIVALRRELEQRPTKQVVETVEVRVEVPVLNGQVEALTERAQRLQDLGGSIVAVGSDILAAIGRVQQTPSREREERAPRGVPAAPARGRGDTAVATLAPAARRRDPAPAIEGEARQLKAGARRMLSALAQLHPTPLTRSQIATLSDISPAGGTFSDYLSAIRSNGLIDEANGTIALTDVGQALVAGDLGTGAPTPEQLLEMWGRKLKAGARRMLAVLYEVYPDGVSRPELAERAEISAAGGTFSDYLSSLRRNGLLDETQPGVVRAGAALFLGSDR